MIKRNDPKRDKLKRHIIQWAIQTNNRKEGNRLLVENGFEPYWESKWEDKEYCKKVEKELKEGKW